jgi:hypothetical protein
MKIARGVRVYQSKFFLPSQSPLSALSPRAAGDILTIY